MQNWSLSSSIILTCTSFWQITFSMYIFFKLLPRIWNQRKILRFFIGTHMKRNKKIMGSWSTFFGNSRMPIRKKWLNQSKNFIKKHFKEYYLASFCWWIPSSCENHWTLVCMPSELGRIGDHQHIRQEIYQSTLFVQDNVLFFDEKNIKAFFRSSRTFATAVQRRVVGWECRRKGLLLQPDFFGFAVLFCGCRLLTVGCRVMVSVVGYNCR